MLVGWGGSKETTPTYRNMSPLCRGELTSYSPRVSGYHRAGWEKRNHPVMASHATPLSRGINLFSASVKVAHRRVGKKKPPRHIRICHPSVEGNLPLIPLSEGCPKGEVGDLKPRIMSSTTIFCDKMELYNLKKYE